MALCNSWHLPAACSSKWWCWGERGDTLSSKLPTVAEVDPLTPGVRQGQRMFSLLPVGLQLLSMAPHNPCSGLGVCLLWQSFVNMPGIRCPVFLSSLWTRLISCGQKLYWYCYQHISVYSTVLVLDADWSAFQMCWNTIVLYIVTYLWDKTVVCNFYFLLYTFRYIFTQKLLLKDCVIFSGI